MQGTKEFREVIWNYLLERAENDEGIAQNLYKDGKTIDGCVNYILREVQKSGKNGFADCEIYSMAIHYYDEESLEEVTTTPNVRIVVNESREGESRQEAKPNKAKEKKRDEVEQLMMFEDDETED